MAKFRGVNNACEGLLNLPDIRRVEFKIDFENPDEPFVFEVECSAPQNHQLRTSVRNLLAEHGFGSAAIRFKQ